MFWTCGYCGTRYQTTGPGIAKVMDIQNPKVYCPKCKIWLNPFTGKIVKDNKAEPWI